jgi:hypothetical protein
MLHIPDECGAFDVISLIKAHRLVRKKPAR